MKNPSVLHLLLIIVGYFVASSLITNCSSEPVPSKIRVVAIAKVDSVALRNKLVRMRNDSVHRVQPQLNEADDIPASELTQGYDAQYYSATIYKLKLLHDSTYQVGLDCFGRDKKGEILEKLVTFNLKVPKRAKKNWKVGAGWDYIDTQEKSTKAFVESLMCVISLTNPIWGKGATTNHVVWRDTVYTIRSREATPYEQGKTRLTIIK